MPESYTTALELESKLPDDVAEADTAYMGVLAWYRDEKTGKQHKLTAGDHNKPHCLPHLYQSKAACRRAID